MVTIINLLGYFSEYGVNLFWGPPVVGAGSLAQYFLIKNFP